MVCCTVQLESTMRLIADVLVRAEQRFNPLQERELILRGFKVTAIENLAVVQDQFDLIDFTDNEIKKVENFPTMRRLSSLVFNNNLISRISATLGEQLPSIHTLILTNNRITSLCEIDHIASLKRLEHLSLLENPVSFSVHYRLYVINCIPMLKSLDYRKVTRKEREEAQKLFSSKLGATIKESIAEEAKAQADGTRTKPAVALTEDQKRQVRTAIENAKTKDEIDQIERQLKTGTFSFSSEASSSSSSGSSSSADSGGGGSSNSYDSNSSSSGTGGGTAAAAVPSPPPAEVSKVENGSNKRRKKAKAVEDDEDVDMS